MATDLEILKETNTTYILFIGGVKYATFNNYNDACEVFKLKGGAEDQIIIKPDKT